MEWKRVEPTRTQKVGWKTLTTKTYSFPDGDVQEYTTFGAEGSQSVATVAVTTEGKIVLARQYRPGPEKMMNEIPGGGVETGEDLEAAARRELQEEVGYVPEKMTYPGKIHKDAYANTVHHYFLGTGCTLHPDGENPDQHEYIEVLLVSPEELIQNAMNAMMTDTEAVFLAQPHLSQSGGHV